MTAHSKGEKELKTDYDEFTANNPTKPLGYVLDLVPEKSFVPNRKSGGL